MKQSNVLMVVSHLFVVYALTASLCPAQNLMLPSRHTSSASTSSIDVGTIDFSSLAATNRAAVMRESQSGAIDNSIDEATYLVGGGDEFFIVSTERSNRFFGGTVNQNGDLFIPEFGEISLGKIPLKKAKEIIRDSVKARFKTVKNVSVALKKVKTATVSVTGTVALPGTYELAGTQRLWDALRLANTETERFDLKKLLETCDLRSVRRTNRDSIEEFDCLAFIYKNDLSQNPYVYPGDMFSVNPATDRVFVHGEMSGLLGGWIPIRSNERARSLLRLFTLSSNTDTSRIELRRRVVPDDGGIPTVRVVSLAEFPDIELANGDVITIPSKKNVTEVCLVTIDGEVRRPGMYPIEKGTTRPRDVIIMAGDTTRYANGRKTVVVRRSMFPAPAGMSIEGKPVDIGDQVGKIRPELGSALSLLTTTRDFTILKTSEHPDLVLEPGDHIMVPRAEKTVYVSGCVRSPGGYPFVQGKNKNYYIALAGGYTNNANQANIYIMAQYGEARQIVDRNIIEDGDIIVVPMSQEYKKLTSIILPVLSTTVGVLGLLVGIYATLR